MLKVKFLSVCFTELMQDAFEAALMQSILTRPALAFPPSTQAPNSIGLPSDAQKFIGAQHLNLSQHDGMLTLGALMRKRQKHGKGKLPPLRRFIESSFAEGEWMTGRPSFDWYSGVAQVNILCLATMAAPLHV